MRHKGFLMQEVLVALVLVGLVSIFFGRQIVYFVSSWQKMRLDGELMDAGRYMFSKLERHLTLETTLLHITDGSIIDCVTEYPDRTMRIYHDGLTKGLYLRRTTREGTGTNPLFIRDCPVDSWQVQRISERQVLIRFVLSKNGRSLDFVRVLECVNGVVENEQE